MEQNNEPVKSYVQEFLGYTKIGTHNSHNHAIKWIVNKAEYTDSKFQKFCNELEVLLERSKLLDEIMSDMKERHKTENKQQ